MEAVCVNTCTVARCLEEGIIWLKVWRIQSGVSASLKTDGKKKMQRISTKCG
ncbi:unnamed protein product [Protopolystoma xenopodis]|uniref:Uncharacterized protein n=1 Tax=Protopolystoma xenopodis TaxID=117903 RepID=A0A3S5CR99_9PLAT|nr:unnamed protein product [Protopolystoma xenopodis]